MTPNPLHPPLGSPGGETPADARQRRLWLAVRQALLLLVGAIEHEYHLLRKGERGA